MTIIQDILKNEIVELHVEVKYCDLDPKYAGG